MFLVVLLALSSLCASCSSKEKGTVDNTTPTTEAKAVPTSSATTEAPEHKPAEKKVTLHIDKVSPKINVKIGETPMVAETAPVTAEQVESATPAIVKSGKIEKVVMEKAAEAEPSLETKAHGSSHADFNALLQKHVTNGMVDYEGFKADANKFDAYLEYLSHHAPSTSDKSKAALAFWMNAYNAFTIKLIVDNLPVASIMDLDGGKVWDRKWVNIGGKKMSLNGIEHDIIRPVFNDPRIHFAVVCAAKSCPPLDSKAFMADTVDEHLERLTKSFINNPKFNTLTEGKITITPIMDWYGKDFGDVRAYVQKYATTSVGDKAKIKFTDYDWSLNGK